jgi:hypothetical protein
MQLIASSVKLAKCSTYGWNKIMLPLLLNIGFSASVSHRFFAQIFYLLCPSLNPVNEIKRTS